jgi:hypothetical protein
MQRGYVIFPVGNLQPGHWRKQAVETRHFRGFFAFSVKLFEFAGLSTIG